MKRTMILAWLHYLAGRLGWPGLLGLALAAAAIGVGAIGSAQLQESNAGLRDGIARLRAETVAGESALSPADARILAQLPGGSDLAPVVAAVHAGARQRQVALEQGEYVWQDGGAGRPARYRMTFPARGTYPQLRGWTSDVLARHPELALEQFDIRRESIASQVVEARVRLSLRVEKPA